MSYKAQSEPEPTTVATLTIRIDEELEQALDLLAKSQHRTKSDLVQHALKTKQISRVRDAGSLTKLHLYRAKLREAIEQLSLAIQIQALVLYN